MSRTYVDLHEPQQKFDKNESYDFMDRFWSSVDKLEKDLEAAEQRALEYSDMVDIKNIKIRELTQKVVTLETKIKMLERG